MTATHARYERAAKAAFDYAYPMGYGSKLLLTWQQVNDIANGRYTTPTCKLARAVNVVNLYRGIARAAIEA